LSKRKKFSISLNHKFQKLDFTNLNEKNNLALFFFLSKITIKKKLTIKELQNLILFSLSNFSNQKNSFFDYFFIIFLNFLAKKLEEYFMKIFGKFFLKNICFVFNFFTLII
jgi:hypothetical protein